MGWAVLKNVLGDLESCPAVTFMYVGNLEAHNPFRLDPGEDRYPLGTSVMAQLLIARKCLSDLKW